MEEIKYFKKFAKHWLRARLLLYGQQESSFAIKCSSEICTQNTEIAREIINAASGMAHNSPESWQNMD